jgi:signal transduction histidine kinase
MGRLIDVLATLRGLARPGDRRARVAQRERVVAAREEERNRLYYDLHDGLGPILASIRLRLDAVAVQVGHAPRVRQMIVDTTQDTARVLEEIYRILQDLRPPELDLIGLPKALRKLASRMDMSSATDTIALPRLRVEASEFDDDLYPSTALAAYRIAAEGLNNAVRHASASEVVIRLRSVNGNLRIDVIDDGVGLRPGAARGVGLSSMARRAAEVGGSCVVRSRLDGRPGTLVRAVLPLWRG